MRFRRVRTKQGFTYQTEEHGTWVDSTEFEPLGPSPYSLNYLTSVADEYLASTGTCLPFQPLSFRDFMVFEQHNIDASRGLVRRFHPSQYKATAVFESITGKVFPKFRPHRLFYKQPMYYMSNHVTFVPSGTPIAFPDYSKALDWELELGFALAQPLRNATPEEAVEAIGAFVVLNDFSARDIQRTEMASGFGPQKAKHFVSSLSEVAVTADEVLPRIHELVGRVSINGTVISTVSSADMQWSIGDMLAHASQSETLRPGELFGTGTLPGGSGMEIGSWLQPGDTLTLTLDGIGELKHDIV